MENKIQKKIPVWLPMLFLLWFSMVIAYGEDAIAVDESEEIREVQVLYELGLLDQVEEDEIESALSREVGLLMILKLLGYNQLDANEYLGATVFRDVDEYSRGWVNLAYEIGIVNGTGEGVFEPERGLSQREYLTMLLRAIGFHGIDVYQQCYEIAGELGLLEDTDEELVKTVAYTKKEAAILMYKALFIQNQIEYVPLINILIEKGIFDNSKAVELGLKEEVQEILKINKKSQREFELVFSRPIEEENYEVLLQTPVRVLYTMVSWNDTRDRLRFITANDLSEGEYNVILQDKSTKKVELQGKIKIFEPQYELEILSDEVVFQKKAPIQIAFYDQYRQMMTLPLNDLEVTVYNSNSNTYHSVLMNEVGDSNQIILRDMIEEGARVGDFLKITIEYDELSVSKTIKVGRLTSGREFKVQYVSNSLGTKPIYVEQKNLKLQYSFRTTKGGSVRLSEHEVNQDRFEDKEVIGNVTFRSSNPEIIDVDRIRIDEFGEFSFETGSQSGVVTLSITNSTTQITTYADIFVFPKAVLSQIDTVGMEQIIAAKEEVTTTVVGYDQFGASFPIEDSNQIRFLVSNGSIIDTTSIQMSQGVLRYNTQNPGNAQIKLLNENNHVVASMDVSVLEQARPVQIVNCDIMRLYEVSNQPVGILKRENIQIVDQYGRNQTVSKNDYVIQVRLVNEEGSGLVDGMIQQGKLAEEGLLIRATTKDVREKYMLEFEEFPDIIYEFEIESIASNRITTYHLADIDDLIVGEENSKRIQLIGFDAEGRQVELSAEKISRVQALDEKIVRVTTNGKEIIVTGLAVGITDVQVYEGESVIETIHVEVKSPVF